MNIRGQRSHRSMLLLVALLFLLCYVNAFEVPFPPSPTEIRAFTVLESSGPLPVTRQLLLGSGTNAEVITCTPLKSAGGGENFFSSLFGITQSAEKAKKSKYDKPVLAFLHGSFHASWCWAEKFMPYFASLGHPCVAFSLQGTGGTPAVEEGAKKVKIDSHVADLDAFLRGLSDDDANSLGLDLGEDPQVVLIGHSFGGLTIMKWLERFYEGEHEGEKSNTINLAGVCLLCSVPPSGNGPMTLRFLRRSFRDSWKITAGFVMKKAITDKAICRDLFFGGANNENGITDDDMKRYQGYFERDTVATIDLSHLAKRLPSKKADKQTGKAQFVDKLPSKSLVIAASDDFIVDAEGSLESAKYLGLESPVVVDSPHDVMLGRKWKNAADEILKWIEVL